MPPEITTNVRFEYKIVFLDLISKYPEIAIAVGITIAISIVFKITMFFKRKKEIKILEQRIETLENLLLHKRSKDSGFAVLKKHLHRPDEPLPNFEGKPIEQD